jgi:hypothetical protein
MAKPTIVTRAGKGSALTWTEGDANVTNLRDATITVAADSGTSQVLDLNDTLTIAGGTNLNSVASATDTITVNLDTTVTGLTSLTSTTVVTDAINGSSANGPITIAPDGTGDVHLNTDSVRIGDNNSDATLSTRGTGDLILTTNEGAVTEGIIRIYDGANGNISLTPNGTGNLVLDGVNWPQADGTSNQVLKTNGTGQLSWTTVSAGATTLDGLTDVNTSGASNNHVLKYNSTATEWQSSLLDIPTTLDSLTDVTSSGATNGQLLAYNSGTSQWQATTVSSGITDVVNDTTPQLGGNLDVNGSSIVSASNANIAITPNGTGNLVLDGVNWPQADGTANQVLKTNGTGQLSWTTVSAGATTLDGLTDVNTSGAMNNHVLKYNSTATEWQSSLLDIPTTLDSLTDVSSSGATNGQVLAYNSGTTQWQATTVSSGGIANVVEDTTPELGGNLDVKDFKITSTGTSGIIEIQPSSTGDQLQFKGQVIAWGNPAGSSGAAGLYTLGAQSIQIAPQEGTYSYIQINRNANGNIILAPDGTGRVSIDGVSWPAADGTNGQVLTTNGAGSASWATASGGGNNIITISAPSVVLPANPTNTTSVFTVRSSGGVSGVSATTGEFTLPAGTYVFTYPTMYTNSTADIQFQTRYYNGGWYEYMSHPVTVLDYNSNASNTMFPMAQGIFTIAASTRFSFRQDTATSRTLSSRASDSSGQGLVTTFLLFRFEKV